MVGDDFRALEGRHLREPPLFGGVEASGEIGKTLLEEGAIVERGAHDVLLAHGGRYAALWREQQLEEEIEAS